MANYTGRHRWTPISKKLQIMYCYKCGLISLKNRVSIKEAQSRCKDREEDND